MNILKDKVAIISGAGAAAPGWGNGQAVAAAFAREGARVFACDLSETAALRTQSLIQDAGGTCEIFVGDMSLAADVAAVFAGCIKSFGKVDILHNNIGQMFPGGICDISEQTWDDAFRINLKSMFLTCKQAIPLMAAQKSGVITNIGSIAAMREFGNPKIAYTASKGAVIAFTKAIAVHHARDNIRANVLTPGVMDTPTFAMSATEAYKGEAARNVDTLRAARGAAIPAGRMGDAWDIAEAAVFLASDAAKYITGSDLVVDGGLSCIAP